MLNQIVLVGRIVEIKEKKESVIVTVAVPQTFKNKDGEYDTNFIDCHLYKGIAENIKEYCKVWDMIGVKGRIQKLENDKQLKLIAERVTFLSSQAPRKEDEE